MQFFYLQGVRDTPIVFSDPNGQALFELIVVEPEVKNIPDTAIYIVSDNQLQLIAQAINGQFDGAFTVKAFDSKFIFDNKLIKPKLLGKSNLFGLEMVSVLPLSEAISEWKELGKEGTSIAVLGGYGGDYTRALICSSVLSSALVEIEESGLTIGVDSYIDSSNPDASKIGPSLQSLNTVQGYPVSINFINGYDAIYVTDEKAMVDLGIDGAENYHDFYAEIFGIKKYNYRNMFLINETARNTLGQTLINLKERADQKTILVDFSGMDIDYINNLAEDLSKRFPDAMLVSLAPVELDVDVTILNLMHLTSDVANLGCLISLVDGVIGLNSINIHIAASYGVPTIVMTRSQTKGGMYQYYQHAEVLVDMDDLFSDSDKTTFKEMDRFEKSFKGLWEIFEKSNAEQAAKLKEESEAISSEENASEKEETEKTGISWLNWAAWTLVGVGVGTTIAFLFL